MQKSRSLTDFVCFFILQQLSMDFEETSFGMETSLCEEDSAKQISCILMAPF